MDTFFPTPNPSIATVSRRETLVSPKWVCRRFGCTLYEFGQGEMTFPSHCIYCGKVDRFALDDCADFIKPLKGNVSILKQIFFP